MSCIDKHLQTDINFPSLVICNFAFVKFSRPDPYFVLFECGSAFLRLVGSRKREKDIFLSNPHLSYRLDRDLYNKNASADLKKSYYCANTDTFH